MFFHLQELKELAGGISRQFGLGAKANIRPMTTSYIIVAVLTLLNESRAITSLFPSSVFLSAICKDFVLVVL
ncbi:hypothetical protein [uncultured Bacteroides sp.]|uniref:hypothetical protein n=1 Tax=uncultured Bacteroides sp. TaxID=162156 RepID=UPI00262D5DE6|nr:hypothetical protein [uncultured Bacteroides sp.]